MLNGVIINGFGGFWGAATSMSGDETGRTRVPFGPFDAAGRFVSHGRELHLAVRKGPFRCGAAWETLRGV